MTGDWDLAEECAQEAFARASERWPVDGVPDAPAAWLKTTARNKAFDRLRRLKVGEEKLRTVAASARSSESDPAALPGDDRIAEGSGIADDRLRLIFTCCHPALAIEAQVALTLRTLVGLSTAEIARAFLVHEETMAKRLVRAKHKIRDARIPYRVPPAHQLPERTTAVLAVLFGLFNEGYSASRGDSVVRAELNAEAIRLAGLLVELMPDEPEARGLLALMLLHDSRRRARVDSNGDIVTLDDQDRGLWDRSRIDEGTTALEAALRFGRPGPYQVQAAISACHARAATASDTDWDEIVVLYDRLLSLVPTPVVSLNRAVAVARRDGAAAGLQLVEDLVAGGSLDGYHLLFATRAQLRREVGLLHESAADYRRALSLSPSDPERRFLEKRLDEIDALL